MINIISSVTTLRRSTEVTSVIANVHKCSIYHISHHSLAELSTCNTFLQDLAIDLRVRLGDWFRVIQLAHGAGAYSANEAQLAILENQKKNITMFPPIFRLKIFWGASRIPFLWKSPGFASPSLERHWRLLRRPLQVAKRSWHYMLGLF